MSDQNVRLSGSMLDMSRTGQLAAALTAPALLTVFMITLILPVSFEIASLRLTPLRVFLLVMFIPLLAQLFSGKAGKMMAVDILMMLYCLWMILSLMVTEGMDRFAFSGISAVELMGGYLVGRCLGLNAKDFKQYVVLQLLLMLFLLPFSILDTVADKQIWHQILNVFGDVGFRGDSSRPRFGLQRVMNGFEHPILFGLFCSMMAANVVYIWRANFVRAFGTLGFVGFMTFLSLSSGAVLSVMIQVACMIWDWVTRSKWKLLITLFVSAFVFLTFASNRGPVVIFIETLAFNKGTAWTRVLQWEYGAAEVLRNPVFGLGMTGDWERPAWLYTASIDNYWLVVAFRHGIPAFAMVAAAIFFGLRQVVKARGIFEHTADIRTGYLITFTGIIFTLATVHIWDAIAVLVYFYLGAGMWIASTNNEADNVSAEDPPQAQRGRRATPASTYSRFPPKPSPNQNGTRR